MSRYTPLWLQQTPGGTGYAASLDRRLLGALWPTASMTGGLVTPGTAMSVNIAAGALAVPITSGSGFVSALCCWDAVENVALNAAPGAGLNRIDVIYAQVRGNDIDSGSNNDFFFGAIAGVAAATPSAPPIPNNAATVAQVYVPSQSATVAAGNITMVAPGPLGAGTATVPPPVSSGAALQSFTDSNGEVWVAKGGVNGGVWKKARDVVHAFYNRSTAGTVPTAAGITKFDQLELDPYGLYNTTSGLFTCPVPGVYRLTATVGAVATAAGQFLQIGIQPNGTIGKNGPTSWSSAASQALTSGCAINRGCLAGDTLNPWIAASASMAIAGSVAANYMQIDYLGTG